MLPQGDTTIVPLNWKLRVPSDRARLLVQLNQQATKVTAPSGVINPTCRGQFGSFFVCLFARFLYNATGKDAEDL